MEAIPSPTEVFGPVSRISATSSPNLAVRSRNLCSSSPILAESRDPRGCLISEQLSLPVIVKLEPHSEALRTLLEQLA